MSEIRLTIDGLPLKGVQGQTILDIALENGVNIPTLCHDERVEMYGACGLCVVEAEGHLKLLRACSTLAAADMVIDTQSERVYKSRQAALELLLSDHAGDCRPPCALACPAETDCQGYVGLIANGEYAEALKLIKDKIPLPASIGRVCPHPCEDACRRELVEEPISIAALKQFAGDMDVARGRLYAAAAGSTSGKKVAIIGGGPGGLTAAYFLRTKGHDATIYDAMPLMGGMLRYGIPEYRLPKDLLQKEVDAIEAMGVTFCNNVKIGPDETLDELRNKYDAVIVAVGAWTSVGIDCPGEELEGVLGGIDFLREIDLDDPVFAGRKVAVVGGGNTAMDACRTAVRLGADEVYNIYRRTKNEMPAEEIEIIEAEEEGVIFKNLTNPLEIIGEDGKVKAIRLQIMTLGEPDSSGRRRPVPLPGEEETIEIDTVIMAIGQKLDGAGLEALEQTRWGTLVADERTFRTNIDGVFAVGDATNNGADIAITAIGEAKQAVDMVDKHLRGEQVVYEPTFLVKSEKTAEDFAAKEKSPRAKMPHRPPAVRRRDFQEVNLGLSEDEARREAHRCLECGCHDFFECKLIDYAGQYNVQPEKYCGKARSRPQEDDHQYIRRNPDKCILCGLCVRICDEVVGATALGLVERGFDTIVKPALDAALRDTDCISCGQCVNVCPTGALTETMFISKQVPLQETLTETVCSFCSVGCQTRLASKGNLLVRSLPSLEKGALLCQKGRFGAGDIIQRQRLAAPLMRAENGWRETSFELATRHISKRLQELQDKYGDDSIAVSVSSRYTNEEAYLIKEYAKEALNTDNVFSFERVKSGLADVLSRDASTAATEDLDRAELIVAVDSDLMKNYGVAGMRIRSAVRKGAKLLLLSSAASLLDSIANMRLDMGDPSSLLGQILKSLLNKGCAQDINSREVLQATLKECEISEEADAAAELILSVGKTVFVFEKNSLTADAARLIAHMAVLSGCGSVIQLLPGANSQGLSDLGVKTGEELCSALGEGKIRGLLIFGEDVPVTALAALDFLAVQDLHLTETAKQAEVVLPAAAFSEISGSFTGADGRIRKLKPAIACPLPWDNITQIQALAAQAGYSMSCQGEK